jgi:hypothetical protein
MLEIQDINTINIDASRYHYHQHKIHPSPFRFTDASKKQRWHLWPLSTYVPNSDITTASPGLSPDRSPAPKPVSQFGFLKLTAVTNQVVLLVVAASA